MPGGGLANSIWGADRGGEIYTLTARIYSLWLTGEIIFVFKYVERFGNVN